MSLRQIQDRSGVLDGCFNFEAIPDNASILHKPIHVPSSKFSHDPGIKALKGLKEILTFFKNGAPGKACLEDF